MAIKRINLIPKNLRPTDRPSAEKLLVGAAAVLALYISLSASFIYFQRYSRTTTMNELSSEMVAVNAELSRLQSNPERINKFVQGEALVSQVRSQRQLWTDIFKELSLLVPKDVWLTNVKTVVDDKGLRLQFFGEAKSQVHMTKFYAGLEQSYFFRSAKLKLSEKLEGFTPPLYRFQMESTLFKPTDGTKK